MKRLVLAGLLAGTLVGCSQEADTQPKQQPNTVKQEAPKPQAPKPQAPKPQAPKVKTDQQAFAEYWSQLEKPFTDLSTDIGLVSDLAFKGTDPDVIISQEYRDEMQAACSIMLGDVQKIEAIPTSSNPKVAAIQNEILLGVQEIKYVAINLPEGVNNLDVNKINNSTQAFNNSSIHFDKAVNLMKEYQK